FLRDALELRRDQGRVSGHDHDDGAYILLPNRVLGDFASDVDASDPQLLPRAVVALHQHADGVSSGFDVEDARTGADTAFEFVADHSRAAADVSFFDRAGMGGVERVPGISPFPFCVNQAANAASLETLPRG